MFTALWSVLYLLVALVCARSVRTARLGEQLSMAPREDERRERTRSRAYRASRLFWSLLVLLVLVLAAGVVLRFDQRVADLWRDLARSNEWYHARHGFQQAVVLALVAAGLAALGLLLRLTRELVPRHTLAFAGALFLVCLIAVRASSHHPVDAWLAESVWGAQRGLLLEGLGIAVIGFGALLNTRWYRGRPQAMPAPSPS
jgi:ABC-type Fe3+ transport system permease subunit